MKLSPKEQIEVLRYKLRESEEARIEVDLELRNLKNAIEILFSCVSDGRVTCQRKEE